MTMMSMIAPSQREVFITLGNRSVVFGPAASLAWPLHFRPETGPAVPPRILDEHEGAEALNALSLRVHGMKKTALFAENRDAGDLNADVELFDADGHHVLIDIKVRERDPKERDLEQAHHRLTKAAHMGKTLEVWHFNVERLKLVVMHLDQSGLQSDELSPLDVWEKAGEEVYDRTQVIEEVDDWIRRVGALYDDIQAWLGAQPHLRCERSRDVTMSEEVMRNFAVTDRDIPLLDVLDAHQVVASFVPRGLWLIGSWGRIDIITIDRTHVLLAVGGAANLEWRLVSSDDRRQTIPFDKNALLTLLDQS